jgi:predicted Zn-dependent protease
MHHRHSPNASRNIPLVGLLTLLLCLPPAGYGQAFNLPEMGDPSGNLLSPAEDERLGQAFMRSVNRSMRVITTPLLTAYVQSLGDRLVEHSSEPGRSFHFFLVDDPTVNAFAGPGGFIGVNTGLVTTSQSESELAAVVAHEIVHVTQNHLLRTFNAVRQVSLPATALAIAALVLGAATDNMDAGLGAATAIQAGVAQRQINFTRAHEEEADSLGIQILAAAGFDPQAMATFFERLGESSRLYDSGQLPEFLRTHPITSNRIAEARARADQFPYRQRPDSLNYHLFRATLKVLSFDNAKKAVAFFHDTLTGRRYRNEEGQRYGYVLALIADRQFGEAKEQLNVLLKKRPDHIAYIVAHALLLKDSKRPKEALKVTRTGLELHPGNYPLSVFYAQMLLHHGQAKEALTVLEKQLAGRSQDSTLFKLLAQAAGDTGNTSLGHQYLAEYYYLSGALEPAIQQLEIALRDRSVSDFRLAKMTARMQDMKEELAELRKRKS